MTIAVIDNLLTHGELLAWQQVPFLVKTRLKEASAVQKALTKVLKHLPPVADPGYGQLFWHPDDKTVWAVFGDGDEEQTIQQWANALKSIPGVRNVRTEAEYGPYRDPEWIRIKKASALAWLNTPYRAMGSLTGGPSPMSNAVVSGLLGAGAGYTAGTVLENLAPPEYVERGRLRKNLAMAGGVGGAALHIPQAVANASINQKATGEPAWLRAIFEGDNQQQMAPTELDWRNHYYGQHKAAWAEMKAVCKLLPPVNPVFEKSISNFVKEAYGTGIMGSNNVPLRPVPVDAFNQAIWNDVHNGAHSSQSNMYGTRDPYSDNSDGFRTPVANAAAATGLVSGIQQMYGNAPLLSPQHFIRGLANAGLDVATARLAGGVLGALGGLTPKAQQQLQQMGLWSGMIRGITGSVLGLQ